jgi:branched-subunit amino acid aminotransferase/4-amino-4-deoxychorismate lyase
MPLFDTTELLGCIKQLVNLDKSWYPDLDYPTQLYIRLCHISTDDQLGVKTPKKTKLFSILNPVHMKTKDLKIKCASDVFKNWPLGHG